MFSSLDLGKKERAQEDCVYILWKYKIVEISKKVMSFQTNHFLSCVPMQKSYIPGTEIYWKSIEKWNNGIIDDPKYFNASEKGIIGAENSGAD